MTAEPSTTTGWQRAKAPVLIFALALVMRIAYAWGSGDLWVPMRLDEPEYSHLAEGLLAGSGYALERGPTAFRPPVYAVFIAGIYAVTGPSAPSVRAVQVLISACTCVLIYYLMRACRLRPPTPVLAGVICALHPLHWILASMMWAETLYFAALVGLFILCARTPPDCPIWRAALIGAAVGAITLLRAEGVLYFGLLAIWLLRWDGALQRRIMAVAALLVAGAVVMSPWVIRNYIVFHRFIPLTTENGVVLWNGNNPLARGGATDPLPENWRGDPPRPDWFYRGWKNLDELQSSDRFRREALQWIEENRGAFILLLFKKAARMFRVDARGNYREPGVPASLNLPYLVLLGICVWGATLVPRSHRRELFLLCLPSVTTVVVSLMAYASTRISAPMSISVVVLAAPAFAEMWRRAVERVTEPISGGTPEGREPE